jgi:hypothetical protein
VRKRVAEKRRENLPVWLQLLLLAAGSRPEAEPNRGRVPPGSEIQMLLVTSIASVHARTVPPPGADRPTRRVETLAFVLGRESSDPQPRTVHDSAECTAVDTSQ